MLLNTDSCDDGIRIEYDSYVQLWDSYRLITGFMGQLSHIPDMLSITGVVNEYDKPN